MEEEPLPSEAPPQAESTAPEKRAAKSADSKKKRSGSGGGTSKKHKKTSSRHRSADEESGKRREEGGSRSSASKKSRKSSRKTEKTAKADKTDKSDKSEKTDKSDKSEKIAKADKSDKTAKADKSEKSDKTEKSQEAGNASFSCSASAPPLATLSDLIPPGAPSGASPQGPVVQDLLPLPPSEETAKEEKFRVVALDKAEPETLPDATKLEKKEEETRPAQAKEKEKDVREECDANELLESSQDEEEQDEKAMDRDSTQQEGSVASSDLKENASMASESKLEERGDDLAKAAAASKAVQAVAMRFHVPNASSSPSASSPPDIQVDALQTMQEGEDASSEPRKTDLREETAIDTQSEVVAHPASSGQSPPQTSAISPGKCQTTRVDPRAVDSALNACRPCGEEVLWGCLAHIPAATINTVPGSQTPLRSAAQRDVFGVFCGGAVYVQLSHHDVALLAKRWSSPPSPQSGLFPVEAGPLEALEMSSGCNAFLDAPKQRLQLKGCERRLRQGILLLRLLLLQLHGPLVWAPDPAEMDGSGPRRRDLTVLVLPSVVTQIRGFVRQLQQRVSIECKVLLLPLAPGAPAADPTQKSLLEKEGEGARQLLIFGDSLSRLRAALQVFSMSETRVPGFFSSALEEFLKSRGESNSSNNAESEAVPKDDATVKEVGVFAVDAFFARDLSHNLLEELQSTETANAQTASLSTVNAASEGADADASSNAAMVGASLDPKTQVQRISVACLTHSSAGFLVGRGGLTKQKICSAASAAFSVVGRFAVWGGRDGDRRTCRFFIQCLLESKEGALRENASKRSDCHVVALGKPQFAALRGSLFGALKIIEQNCGVLCILDDGRNGEGRLLLLSSKKQSRMKAEAMLSQALRGEPLLPSAPQGIGSFGFHPQTAPHPSVLPHVAAPGGGWAGGGRKRTRESVGGFDEGGRHHPLVQPPGRVPPAPFGGSAFAKQNPMTRFSAPGGGGPRGPPPPRPSNSAFSSFQPESNATAPYGNHPPPQQHFVQPQFPQPHPHHPQQQYPPPNHHQQQQPHHLHHHHQQQYPPQQQQPHFQQYPPPQQQYPPPNQHHQQQQQPHHHHHHHQQQQQYPPQQSHHQQQQQPHHHLQGAGAARDSFQSWSSHQSAGSGATSGGGDFGGYASGAYNNANSASFTSNVGANAWQGGGAGTAGGAVGLSANHAGCGQCRGRGKPLSAQAAAAAVAAGLCGFCGGSGGGSVSSIQNYQRHISSGQQHQAFGAGGAGVASPDASLFDVNANSAFASSQQQQSQASLQWNSQTATGHQGGWRGGASGGVFPTTAAFNNNGGPRQAERWTGGETASLQGSDVWNQRPPQSLPSEVYRQQSSAPSTATPSYW